MYLDTLALARFETGQIDEAIEIEKKAIEGCDSAELDELRKALERFQRAREQR